MFTLADYILSQSQYCFYKAVTPALPLKGRATCYGNSTLLLLSTIFLSNALDSTFDDVNFRTQ